VVPPTTTLPYPPAQPALARAHLGAEEVLSFDESVPKGIVMSTDPGAGQEVRRGTDVKVTVSKGPERYAVPNVVNKSAAEARDQITAQKLVVGTSKEAYDEKVAAGLVVRVDPKVGAQLKRGSKVNLVISKGRQPIAVKDFTNKPASEAVDALSKAGLEVDATEQANSDTVAKGNVISQSPAGGTLFKGDSVKLVVSKGPVLVKVPDVQGKQEAEATQILKAAGFNVTVERFMGGIFGTVRSQEPGANSEQPKGSTIKLVIV
jgi:serine/threonine-protein kinase